jgi:hypothetical protein
MARGLFRTLVAAVVTVALLRALAPLLLGASVRAAAAAANTFEDLKLADNLELVLQQMAAADAARATSRRLLVQKPGGGDGGGAADPQQAAGPELRGGPLWDAFVQAVLPGSSNPSYRIVGGTAAPPSRFKVGRARRRARPGTLGRRRAMHRKCHPWPVAATRLGLPSNLTGPTSLSHSNPLAFSGSAACAAPRPTPTFAAAPSSPRTPC